MQAEIRIWKMGGNWHWTMCQESSEGYEIIAQDHDLNTLDNVADSFPDFETLPAIFK